MQSNFCRRQLAIYLPMTVDRPVHPFVDYTALAEVPRSVVAVKVHRRAVVAKADLAGFVVVVAEVAEDLTHRHRSAVDRSCLGNDDVEVAAAAVAAVVVVAAAEAEDETEAMN